MNLHDLTFQELQDPRVWKLLREQAPMCHVPYLNLWVVTRHDDVRHLLDNASNEETLLPVRPFVPEAFAVMGPLFEVDKVTAAGDPPAYLRYREALVATFPYRPGQVEPWLPAIERRTAELVAAIAPRQGPVDLVNEFAALLSLNVIADVLGIPDDPDERMMIKGWADGQIAGVWGDPTPEEQVSTMKGLVEWWWYCKQFANGPLPEGSVTAAMRRWRDAEGEGLTGNEIASFAFNIMVAGYETTRSLIANTMYLALTRPEHLAHLGRGGRDAARFVDAVNMFDPPIIGWLRKLKEPYGGMPEGARTLLMLGSANRDFDGGEEFRLDKPPVKSLAFGATSHHCIGISLARAEAGHAVTELAARFPDLRLVPGFVRRNANNVGFRAMLEEPVLLHA
jgi:cytochrome P450